MGKRSGAFLVAALVLVPMTAQAQQGKPSGNFQTRSAEVYIQSGKDAKNPIDKTKFFNQALEQARAALSKDANNALAWQIVGRTQALMGNVPAADSALDKAESLWSGYVADDAPVREAAWVEAYNGGVKAVQANNLDEAVQKLQMADQIYQGRPDARMVLASLYLNKQDYDNAAKYYKGALEILNGPASKNLQPAQQKVWDDNRQKAMDRLGQLLMATRKYDDAVTFYQQQLALNPNQPGTKLTLARAMALAGKEGDAKTMFVELINTPNLSDEQYADVGVSLFRAQDFANAAAAFRKAVALNPYNHGALYNLSQALLAQAQPIEEAREKAAPTARKPFATQLAPIFAELKEVTGKFLALEPANATALKLASATARGEADVATDPKVEAASKAQALKYLEQADSLAFDISEASLTPTEDGVKVSGMITNRKLPAAAPIKLKVSFLGKEGGVLDAQDVTVPAPGKEQMSDLNVTSKVKDITGWKYEVVK